jgi:tetratricopeptide (TPR) repeat protein
VRIGRGLASAGAGLALAGLVAGFCAIELWRDAVYGEPKPAESVLYLQSGEVVKRLSLSFTPFLAGVYWVRAVQFYGGTRLSVDANKRYDLLSPLLDVATTLDPQFNIAYRFGAIYLAEEFPGGAGRPDQAVALLQKGFHANPSRWQYLQDIGFVYYWWLGDYRTAAEWFRRGSEIPGAPWWLKPMAAVTLAQGGDRANSRQLWRALLETADNDWLRKSARHRLSQLDALDALDQLNARVNQFRAHVGRAPSSWDEVVAVGLLRGLPLDPSGAPYRLDPNTATVTLAPESALNPLPTGATAGRAAQ